VSDTESLSLLVDLRGASRLTGISVKSLRRAIERGELATVRIGGKIWIERTAIDELIERHRQPVGAAP
jgi:excisionase family DNA binding protein